MWPFRASKPDENLVKRVFALESEVDALKRDRKAMLVEWESMFEKFAKLYARLNKRAKQAESLEDAPESTNATPVGPTLHRDINPAAARLLAGGTNVVLPR